MYQYLSYLVFVSRDIMMNWIWALLSSVFPFNINMTEYIQVHTGYSDYVSKDGHNNISHPVCSFAVRFCHSSIKMYS